MRELIEYDFEENFYFIVVFILVGDLLLGLESIDMMFKRIVFICIFINNY